MLREMGQSEEDFGEMDSGISAGAESNSCPDPDPDDPEDEDSETEVVESDSYDWNHWNQEVHGLLNEAWINIRDGGGEGSRSEDDCDLARALSFRSCWSLRSEEDETPAEDHTLTADFERRKLAGEMSPTELDSSGDSGSNSPSITSTVMNYDDVEISEGSQVCVDAINDTLMSTYRLNYNPPLGQGPLTFWTEAHFVLIKEFVGLFPETYPSITKLQLAESPDPEYSSDKHAELEAEYNNSILTLQENNDIQNTSGSNQQFRRRPETSSNNLNVTTDTEPLVKDCDQTEPLVPDPEPVNSAPSAEDFPPFPSTSETQQPCPNQSNHNANLPAATPKVIRPVPVRTQHWNPTYSQGPQQHRSYSIPHFTNQAQQNCYFPGPGPIHSPSYNYYAHHHHPWQANSLNPYNIPHWIYKRHHQEADMAMYNYCVARSLRLRRQMNYSHYYQLPSFPQKPLFYELRTVKTIKSYSHMHAQHNCQVKRGMKKVKARKSSSTSSVSTVSSSTQSTKDNEKASKVLPLPKEQKDESGING